MRKILLLLTAIGIVAIIQAQSISPSIVNATGGSFNNSASNISVDWSVAEMSLVNTLQSTGTNKVYILTNGVLQPDAKKGGKKGAARFSTDEVKVFPNPAVDYVEVAIATKESGTFHLQLYNSIGQLVYTKNFKTAGAAHIEKISVSTFAAGTYLLSVEMESSMTSETKKSIYTIVKLDTDHSKYFLKN